MSERERVSRVRQTDSDNSKYKKLKPCPDNVLTIFLGLLRIIEDKIIVVRKKGKSWLSPIISLQLIVKVCDVNEKTIVFIID